MTTPLDPVGDPPGGHLLVATSQVLVDEADHRQPDEDRWLGAGAVGTVSAVGDGVDPELVGVAVLVTGPAPCGHCATCRRGQTHVCLTPTREGPASRGIGGAREQLVVPVDRVTAVPTGLDAAAAAVLGGAGLTGAAAVRGVARLVPGERIALVGDAAATVGAAVAVAAGARVVVACPTVVRDQDVLRDWGATAVGALESLGELVADHTQDVGVDACVVAGAPAEAVPAALAATRPGGTVVVVDPIRTTPVTVTHGRSLVDAPFGRTDPRRDLPWLVPLLLDRGIDLARLTEPGAPGLAAAAAAADGRGAPTRTVHTVT